MHAGPGPTTGTARGGEWRVEKQRLSWPILDAFARRPAGRHPGHRRLQPRRQRGRRLLRGEPAPRRALERGQGLPAAGILAAPTCASSTGAHVRPLLLDAPAARRSARRRAAKERALPRPAGAGRGAAGGRRDRLAADPAALGHRRPGALVQSIGVALAPRAARRRRQPAGPPAAARRLPDRRRAHAQRRVDAMWASAPRWASTMHCARSGPMSMAPSQLGAFTRPPEYAPANCRVSRAAAVARPPSASRCTTLPPSPSAYATCVRPASDRPDATSADPHASPAIRPNYLSTPEDQRVAVDSIRLARRLVGAPALARYRPVEWKPGAELQSEEDLEAGGRRHRHDDLPSGRHGEDGPSRRSAGGGGFPA